jgi:hypothetical protein
MKLGTYAARLSCMPPGKQPTFRCALCGPASFANGQRRIEFECAAGKSGLRVTDNDDYVRCAGHCRQKLSIECLEAIATAAEKLKKELPTRSDPLLSGARHHHQEDTIPTRFSAAAVGKRKAPAGAVVRKRSGALVVDA